MLQAHLQAPSAAQLEDAITARLAGGRVLFVDTTRVAEIVFANHLLANVVLLGAAYQLGGLPLPADAIDSAIARSGSSAETTRAAFEWGRWAAYDWASVAARLDATDEGGAALTAAPFEPSPRALALADSLLERRIPAELRDLVRRRAAQVVDYQDAAPRGAVPGPRRAHRGHR